MHRSRPTDAIDEAADDLPRGWGWRRWIGFAGRGIAAVTLTGGLSLLAHETRLPIQAARTADADSIDAKVQPDTKAQPFVPAVAVTVRPVVPVAASAPRYRLDEADALDPVKLEPARIHQTTGQRVDSLSQGSFVVGEAPYLRITVSEGSPASTSLFVTIARRAADGQGLAVVRTGERGLIETKFGPVETLEATLSGPATRICTGFSNLAQNGLAPMAPRFDGWLCAPLGQPPEPRAIACALDKLAPNGQASASLDAAYRAFEVRRVKGCASAVADAAKREPAGETGSIAKRPLRHNQAKVRQNTQAKQ